MFFNPFNLVNKQEVYQRVEKLRKKHAGLSERELCELVIASKSRLCGLSGAVTALPAVLPGLGTGITLIGGTAFDIAAVSYLMAEMVLEISVIYGRDINLPGVSREAIWVIGVAAGADMSGKAAGKGAIKQMANQVFVRMMREALWALGIKATQRSILKIIPLAGSIISGSVNYYVCRRAGRMAADHYQKNSYQQWADDFIDVTGKVME